jgi:hypothetical protein
VFEWLEVRLDVPSSLHFSARQRLGRTWQSERSGRFVDGHSANGDRDDRRNLVEPSMVNRLYDEDDRVGRRGGLRATSHMHPHQSLPARTR